MLETATGLEAQSTNRAGVHVDLTRLQSAFREFACGLIDNGTSVKSKPESRIASFNRLQFMLQFSQDFLRRVHERFLDTHEPAWWQVYPIKAK